MNNWIDASKQSPKSGEYLAVLRNWIIPHLEYVEKVKILEFCDIREEWSDPSSDYLGVDGDVTHWQELPKPPGD